MDQAQVRRRLVTMYYVLQSKLDLLVRPERLGKM